MKKYILCYLTLIFTFYNFTFAQSKNIPTETIFFGEVNKIEGEVNFITPGFMESHPLKVNQILTTDTSISTQNNSRLIINLINLKSSIEIGQNSFVRIYNDEKNIFKIEVLDGFIQIKKEEEAQILVLTKSSLLKPLMGNSFFMYSYVLNQSSVLVGTGEIEYGHIEYFKENKIKVSKNHFASLDSGKITPNDEGVLEKKKLSLLLKKYNIEAQKILNQL